MRTPIVPALLALVAALSLATHASAHPSLTLQGGLSVASVDADVAEPVFEPASRRGFSGQLALGFPLARGFAVAPEIGYSMRGFSFGEIEITDFVGPSRTVEKFLSREVVTLSLPVSATLPAQGALRLVLHSGPQLEIGRRERIELRGSFDSNTESELLETTGFDWLFGAGFDVAAGPGVWRVQGRYVHGLSNLARDEAALFEAKTRSFEVMTGYTFGP